MKSIEDPADRDYGSRVLAAVRKQGLSTRHWNAATTQAMETASRLEFLALFKKHDRLTSYALIELIRTGTPECLVDRIATEKRAREQFEAMVPLMFMGLIS